MPEVFLLSVITIPGVVVLNRDILSYYLESSSGTGKCVRETLN